MRNKTGKKAMRPKRSEIAILVLILAVSAALRLYPAVTNDFPKGSDSFFHARIAGDIMENGQLVSVDPLTGSVNPYPPAFHVLLALLFYLGDAFVVAKFIGPVLGILSIIMLFAFLRGVAGVRIALASVFVYGASVEAINRSVMTAPENLGLLLIFTSLYFFDKYVKGNDRRFLYASVLCSSLIALTHTLSFIMLVVFLLAFFGPERGILRLLAAPVIIALGWLGYTAGLGAASSLIFYSPRGVDFLFAGVSAAAFALAALGAKGAVNFRLVVPAYILLLFWALFVPAYPERVLTFSAVLLSVIAGFGLNDIISRKNKSKYMLLAFLTAILLAHAAEIQNPFGYAMTELTQQDYSVLQWAKDSVPAGATIASTWQVSGVWIQAIAERRTILAAFHESIPDYEQRRSDLALMFTSPDKSEIKNIAAKYNASYIFINSYEERALYAGAVGRLKAMFPVARENEYAHLFSVQ